MNIIVLNIFFFILKSNEKNNRIYKYNYYYSRMRGEGLLFIIGGWNCICMICVVYRRRRILNLLLLGKISAK